MSGIRQKEQKIRGYNKYTYGNHQVIILRREHRKFHRVLFFILLFFFFLLALIGFLRSSYFALEEITIKGLERLGREDVLAASGVRNGDNTWRLSLREIREEIENLARVEEAEIHRRLPSGLEIIITEKKEAALLPYQGRYLELTQEGIIIGAVEQYQDGLPLITGLEPGAFQLGDRAGSPEQAALVTAFLQALSEVHSLLISEFNAADPQNGVLITVDGLEVRVGDYQDMSNKLEILHQVLPHLFGKRQGYLDLRAKNPVFRPY